MNLHTYAVRLFLIAKINPEMWDFLIPMAPKYSKGTQNVIAGQIVKAVSTFTKDVVLKNEAYSLGQSLYMSGTKYMDYDDDFFYCGNISITIPHVPSFGIQEDLFNTVFRELNPQPMPPKYFAAILSLIAESITDKVIAGKLQALSARLLERKSQ